MAKSKDDPPPDVQKAIDDHARRVEAEEDAEHGKRHTDIIPITLSPEAEKTAEQYHSAGDIDRYIQEHGHKAPGHGGK